MKLIYGTFLILSMLVSCKEAPQEIIVNTSGTYNDVSIGEQIRKARLEKGITQLELSKAVGMRQNSISLIEDGMAVPISSKIVAIQNYLEKEFVLDGLDKINDSHY